jgi:hypothetical protein
VVPKKPAKLLPDMAETDSRIMHGAIADAPKTLPVGERYQPSERTPQVTWRATSVARKHVRERSNLGFRSSVVAESERQRSYLRRVGVGTAERE